MSSKRFVNSQRFQNSSKNIDLREFFFNPLGKVRVVYLIIPVRRRDRYDSKGNCLDEQAPDGQTFWVVNVLRAKVLRVEHLLRDGQTTDGQTSFTIRANVQRGN